MLKKVIFFGSSIIFCISSLAFTNITPNNFIDTYEHGGGCRKDSPAGMCCHMETRTGLVHCH